MNKYEKLKEIIKTVNPKKFKVTDFHTEKFPPKISLADVLLAIKNQSSEYMQKEGMISCEQMDTMSYWNLKDDSLDNQSDKTKKFLIKLLCPSS